MLLQDYFNSVEGGNDIAIKRIAVIKAVWNEDFT